MVFMFHYRKISKSIIVGAVLSPVSGIGHGFALSASEFQKMIPGT